MVERGDKCGPVVARTELFARLEFPAEDSVRDVGATGRSAAAVTILSGALAPYNAAPEQMNPEGTLSAFSPCLHIALANDATGDPHG
jgi:hypothetical protein